MAYRPSDMEMDEAIMAVVDWDGVPAGDHAAVLAAIRAQEPGWDIGLEDIVRLDSIAEADARAGGAPR